MEDRIRRLYPQFSQLSVERYKSDKITFGKELEKKEKLTDEKSKVCRDYKSFTAVKNEIINDINKLDCFVENNKDKTKTVFSALSPIIPIRRISSVPDNIDDGNYAKAAGLLGLMAVNLPEDTRDLKDAYKQVFKGKLPSYDYKNCQAPFSFFRGTALEPIVNKMGKVGVYLHKADVPLNETKFGNFLENHFKFNLNELNSEPTNRFVPKVTTDESGKSIIREVEVFALKVEGKSLSRLIGRALLRIPVISVFALGILELPNIIKKVNNVHNINDKAKEGAVQTLKSSVNVASIIVGIGLVGAMFARKGPAYSLLGMGIGSVAGVYSSKEAQKKLNNFFINENNLLHTKNSF